VQEALREVLEVDFRDLEVMTKFQLWHLEELESFENL
jgi:hypothetical protein